MHRDQLILAEIRAKVLGLMAKRGAERARAQRVLDRRRDELGLRPLSPDGTHIPECDTVLAQLPDDLQPVFAVASLTGWRVKSELLTRQWAHVDFQSGWLRLEPGETKNAEGRQFPLTPALRAVLERQRARTLAIEKATRTIIP